MPVSLRICQLIIRSRYDMGRVRGELKLALCLGEIKAKITSNSHIGNYKSHVETQILFSYLKRNILE